MDRSASLVELLDAFNAVRDAERALRLNREPERAGSLETHHGAMVDRYEGLIERWQELNPSRRSPSTEPHR